MVAKGEEGGAVAGVGGVAVGVDGGQIVLIAVVVLVFEGWVGGAQAGRWVNAFCKHFGRAAWVKDFPPSKQGGQGVKCDGTSASAALRARGARPIVGVEGGVVEVLFGRAFVGAFPFLRRREKKREEERRREKEREEEEMSEN